MSMIKRVTLTINKNNNSVKLSCPLNFYKNDTLTLYFEVEKYNFNINNDTGYEKIIPLSAIAYVETPEGIDSIQTAIINDNLIKVNLSQYHTSFIGTSRMQLVIRDKDGCQCATPCFTFSVNDLINDNEIITDEDGNIITSENDIPIVHGHGNGYNAISDLDEIEDLDNAYMLITKDEKSYKARTSLFGAANLDFDNFATKDEMVINLSAKSDTTHTHDDRYATINHQHSYNELSDKPTIPSVDGLATETYVDNAIANAQLGGGNAGVKLDRYATKDDLLTKADKEHTHEQYLTEHQNISHLATKEELVHNHDNQYAPYTHTHNQYLTGHQSLTHLALKEHQHSYNELSDKPTIPSIDGLATETYVNQAIANANTVGGYTIWVGTQSQYDAIETKSNTTIYMIKG